MLDGSSPAHSLDPAYSLCTAASQEDDFGQDEAASAAPASPLGGEPKSQVDSGICEQAYSQALDMAATDTTPHSSVLASPSARSVSPEYQVTTPRFSVTPEGIAADPTPQSDSAPASFLARSVSPEYRVTTPSYSRCQTPEGTEEDAQYVAALPYQPYSPTANMPLSYDDSRAAAYKSLSPGRYEPSRPGCLVIPADEGAINDNINGPSDAPYSPAVPSPGTPLFVTCWLGVSVFSALLHCISW